jgi:hypothetical protein
MTITEKWKGVEIPFPAAHALFFVSLWHVVLDSNNLKQNCFKLHRARHFPTSSSQPLNCPCSKSPLFCPVSSRLLQAPGWLWVLKTVLDRVRTVWRTHKGTQNANGSVEEVKWQQCSSWAILQMVSRRPNPELWVTTRRHFDPNPTSTSVTHLYHSLPAAGTETTVAIPTHIWNLKTKSVWVITIEEG